MAKRKEWTKAEEKAKASRRAKASWKNGPLAKWRASRYKQLKHRVRAVFSWAEGGALREALEERKAEEAAAAKA